MSMSNETEESGDAPLIAALSQALGDRYHFVSRLGSGAFGDVYCLHDSMLERDVAVKRVRLDAFAEETQRDELRERSIREAKVAARLKHPHIVTIYDVVDKPGMNFIIMEYIEGRTLAHLLKEKGRLSLGETLRLLGQTASALDFAHTKGIVHRDIKPANIMVESASGGVKVMDFGIAKSESFTDLTAAGSVLGTPNYMSPEQARGESTIEKRADLFSLGCVLYECLVGQKAFVGKNVMATLMSIMNDRPRPFDPEALGLHPDVADFMTRALAKEVESRFSSGAELLEALRALPPVDQATVVIAPPASPEPPVAAMVVTRREPGNTSSFDARLQGNLNETTAAELIREVYSSRNTGILHFRNDEIAKRIYFKTGNVVFANSDLNDDRLGEFLIRTGEIDRDAFDRATEKMQKTGRRFGTTLTELGIVAADKLTALVRRQVEEIIYSVFSWEKGAYGFEFLERPVEEDIIVNLSTAELILIGVRRIGSLDHIRSGLGSLDRVLRHTENPLLLYQKMTLTTSEGYVLSRIDGSTSVAEIASISPLGEDETLRCIFALVSAGVAELTSKASSPTSRLSVSAIGKEHFPPPDLQREVPSATDAEEPPAREWEKTSSEPTEQEQATIDDIVRKHGSLASSDYYQILEVSPGASELDIKKGYYAMARKYHPDRHHLPHMRDVQSLLEELFAKVTVAYQDLSDPAARRRYDGARQQKGRVESEASAASSSSSNAPGEQPYTVPTEVVAERHYQKGMQHFERMEYHDAIQCARESVRMLPGEPRFHKLLARTLSKNPHWLKEAEEHFMIALKADEFDIECLLGLAENYDSANLSTRAARVYERILAYDPDNAVAHERLYGKGKKGKKSPR
jgi:serine/threonine protein kinase/curved DNA-binding protein CbpA